MLSYNFVRGFTVQAIILFVFSLKLEIQRAFNGSRYLKQRLIYLCLEKPHDCLIHIKQFLPTRDQSPYLTFNKWQTSLFILFSVIISLTVPPKNRIQNVIKEGILNNYVHVYAQIDIMFNHMQRTVAKIRPPKSQNKVS